LHDFSRFHAMVIANAKLERKPCAKMTLLHDERYGFEVKMRFFLVVRNTASTLSSVQGVA